MTLQYYTKQVYGNTFCYLADARQAMQWNSVTGRKTITEREMSILSDMMGVQFERVFEPTN